MVIKLLRGTDDSSKLRLVNKLSGQMKFSLQDSEVFSVCQTVMAVAWDILNPGQAYMILQTNNTCSDGKMSLFFISG